MTQAQITSLLREHALELGALDARFTHASPLDPAPLKQWLDKGFHDQLHYMDREAPPRHQPDALAPGTRSLLCIALPLPRSSPEDAFASFATTQDYHLVARRILQSLAELAQKLGARQTRGCVDSAPIQERSLAKRAGIGWIGGHGCVVHPEAGSWIVLAELLLDLLLPPDSPIPSRCGNCRRCIDACPTGALVSHGVVDARKCLSNLTIERKGPTPRSLRSSQGHLLFGCDICIRACPWGKKPPPPHPSLTPRIELESHPTSSWLSLSNRAFKRRCGDTPLTRAGRNGLARNACTVLGNRGDRDQVPALINALENATNEAVRAHAAWALAQLGGEKARQALSYAINTQSPWVAEEAKSGLEDT